MIYKLGARVGLLSGDFDILSLAVERDSPPEYLIDFVGGSATYQYGDTGDESPKLEILLKEPIWLRLVASLDDKLFCVVESPKQRKEVVTNSLDSMEILPLSVGETISVERPFSQGCDSMTISSLSWA